MKLITKLAALVLSVAVLPISLFACSDEAPEASEPAKKDTNVVVTEDYIVVFPTNDQSTANLARNVRSAISEEIGAKLKVQSDYIIEDEPIAEKEILIGDTNRQESEDAYKALEDNEWSVSVANSKIVIAGKTAIALRDAVEYFVSTYVADKGSITLAADTHHKSASVLYQLNWENGAIVDTGISGGYPRMYSLQDGTLMLAYDGMYVQTSKDRGRTWSKPIKASPGERGTANATLFQTEDGTVYIGYRSTYYNDDGSFYSAIKVSYSTDNGKTWQQHSTVYENTESSGDYRGVWEPHFGMMNGMLTCFFANDSTNVTSAQNIEYLQWDTHAQKWINRTIVSDGAAHESRDGMPVWVALADGGYACVMEASSKDGKNGFVIQLTYSEDGKKWSDPVEVMRAKDNGTSCAAPYIVELPNGQIVVSCHTNELNGDASANPLYMGTVISDGTPVADLKTENFSDHSYPHYDNTKKPYSAYMWNGMYVYGPYLFAFSNGPKGIRLVRLNYTEQVSGK